MIPDGLTTNEHVDVLASVVTGFSVQGETTPAIQVKPKGIHPLASGLGEGIVDLH